MRTVSRLRLLFLVFGTCSVLLPCSLSHHVEAMSPPPKHTVPRTLHSHLVAQYTSVEMVGIEPTSTMPLLERNYNNSLIYYETILALIGFRLLIYAIYSFADSVLAQ